MGRKGENIFLRKDGRYEGRYIKKYDYLGKAIYGSVYAKTYQECKRKKLKVQKEDTIQKKFYQGRSSKKDLNALLKEWLEEKRGKLKESSYGRYYQLIETHIKKELGTLKVNKLNSDIVNTFLKSKLRCGRLDGQGGLSKNTVYDIALILKQVFKYYKIQIDVMSISKAVGRGKSFYPKEKKQLEHYLLDLNDPKVIGILLSLFLGLREGEICGLRWDDIDLENRIILIKRTVTRVKSFNTKRKTKVIITVPKTEYSIRELPIPEKLYGLLVHFFKGKSECYVLTNTKKYMDPRSYYNYYQKILKSISIGNHTYHDLRHTFATNCIEVGMDARNLMELLGHSNVTTTMNIYVHGTMENKRNFIDQL